MFDWLMKEQAGDDRGQSHDEGIDAECSDTAVSEHDGMQQKRDKDSGQCGVAEYETDQGAEEQVCTGGSDGDMDERSDEECGREHGDTRQVIGSNFVQAGGDPGGGDSIACDDSGRGEDAVG